MAVLHFINYHRGQNAAATGFVLKYITQDRKTMADGQKYVTGIHCCPESAMTEFQNTRQLYRQTEGRQFYHLVQSFPPEDKITPAQAHEIALEFAEKCSRLHGFELVAATHCDRDHIHTHFVFNSVNAETGKKFHISQKEVEEMMKLSDEIVSAHGFSVLPPPEKRKEEPMTDREYRSAERGESWKIQLAAVITDAMEQSGNARQFRTLLAQEGYGITWTAERKYITYTCPNGKKCRDSRLHEEKYKKENMEYEFRIREEIYGRAGTSGKAAGADRRKGDPLRDGDGSQLGGASASASDSSPAAAGGGKTAGGTGYGGTAGVLYEPAAGNSAGGRNIRPGGCTAISGEAAAGDEGFQQPDGENGGNLFCTGWEHEREIWQQSLRSTTENKEVYSQSLLDLSDPFCDFSAVGGAAALLLADVGSAVQGTEDPEERKRRIEAEENASNLGTVLGTAVGLAMRIADLRSCSEEKPAPQKAEENITQTM